MSYGKHALVIDDEPIICSICSRILSREGFIVDTALNGVDGRRILQKRTYDIYVMDIKTPGMTGMELYQFLAEKQPGVLNRVLFITGDTMSGNITGFLQNAPVKFLAKPFTPAELRGAVSRITRVGN